MNRAIVTVILLLLTSATATQAAYALNPSETTEGNLSVFGIDGHPANVTITIDSPMFASNQTTLTFTLTVKEFFTARDTTTNPTGYKASRETLDAYLNGGVLVDFDRARAIDTLWTNWADTQNATYLQEEHALYTQMHWVNFSKSGDAYTGTAILPSLPAGTHNATVWVRAEQDEVTTYTPLWAAFTQTINLSQEQPSPTPIPEITPITLTLIVVLVPLLVVLTKRRLIVRFS